MPVKIRLSRGGAKKRPFYRIVVADSRRSRDGKYIERIGTFNPMLPKDHKERLKIDVEKAKEWLQKGAQPSDRIHIFLSNIGLLDKPVITEKTKKHLPRKKLKEKETPKADEGNTSEAKPATAEKEKSVTKKFNKTSKTDKKKETKIDKDQATEVNKKETKK